MAGKKGRAEKRFFSKEDIAEMRKLLKLGKPYTQDYVAKMFNTKGSVLSAALKRDCENG